MRRLTDYRVLTFDCYGTLIDWECGIWDALQPLIMRNAGCAIGRDDALRAFARCESAQERATPGMRYPELLARVHRSIAERLGLRTDNELDAAFGASVPHWPAFPDTATQLGVPTSNPIAAVPRDLHEIQQEITKAMQKTIKISNIICYITLTESVRLFTRFDTKQSVF